MHRLLHKATFPFELTNGNDGRGSKWFSSSKLRIQFEKQLRDLGHVRTPFDRKVIVRVTRHWAKRQREWDSSSVGRGNWKEIEDALVACGWFVDDGPKYIRETRYLQVPSVDGVPRITVEVFEAKQVKAKELKFVEADSVVTLRAYPQVEVD